MRTRAIPECLSRCFHDEALYKFTFTFAFAFTFSFVCGYNGDDDAVSLFSAVLL